MRRFFTDTRRLISPARRIAVALLGMLLGIGLIAVPIVAAEDNIPFDAPAVGDAELEAVTRLLEIAWSGDKLAPQAAKQTYESLSKQVKDRQRWHYAYGVAALKMKRYPEAARAFQASREETGDFHFSAWKGWIWTELTLKRYNDGIEHLESLAATVASAEFTGPSEVRDHVAVWIGQTVVALEKIVTSPKTLERLAEMDARLRDLWPGDLIDSYESGRDYSETQYAELMSVLKVATDDAKSREELARTQKQQKLQADIADAEKQRENLKKTAEELQKQVDQKTLQIDKQLARLERDYSYLETRANSVMRSMALVQSRLNDVQQRAAENNNQFTNRNNLQVQQLNTLLGLYQQELDGTMYRANLVVQRAMQGMQLREMTLQQSQQAAGELGQQHESLGKWQDRLARDGENLKKAKIKGSSMSVRQKRQQAKSLNTYLEFDPEWERIQLTEPPSKS